MKVLAVVFNSHTQEVLRYSVTVQKFSGRDLWLPAKKREFENQVRAALKKVHKLKLYDKERDAQTCDYPSLEFAARLPDWIVDL